MARAHATTGASARCPAYNPLCSRSPRSTASPPGSGPNLGSRSSPVPASRQPAAFRRSEVRADSGAHTDPNSSPPPRRFVATRQSCGSGMTGAASRLPRANPTRLTTCSPRGASSLMASPSSPRNVDGLHERAGTRDVIRFHGSIWELRCWKGCAEAPRRWRDETTPFPRLPPPCPHCGGLTRPGVVWFGEAIDNDVISWSLEATDCDLFLTVGTSALVHPAASLLREAKKGGAFTVEINLEPTPASDVVDLSLQGPASTSSDRRRRGSTSSRLLTGDSCSERLQTLAQTHRIASRITESPDALRQLPHQVPTALLESGKGRRCSQSAPIAHHALQ